MTVIGVTGLRGVPASWGGVERQCEELYVRLAANGADVTVYARKSYVKEDVSSYKGVKIVRLPTIDTTHLEAIVHTVLAVLHMAFRLRPDIVHVYGQGPCLTLPLVRLLMPRAKVFFTCGGIDWERRKWSSLASGVIRLGEWCSARLTHVRIMVSKELRRAYRERCGVDSNVVYNGVSVRDAVPLGDLPQRAGLDVSAGRYVVFVGRLVPEKRVEDVIAAFRSRKRTLKLLIVGGTSGDGEYPEKLAAAAGDDGAVVFAGYRFDEELAALFSNARAYVSASELEGLPLTLLEAMAWGLPCVVSNIPPHEEVLAKTVGLDFPVHDTAALSARMDEIEGMTDAEAAAVGRDAREAVERAFSWDTAADLLGALYEKAGGKGGKA